MALNDIYKMSIVQEMNGVAMSNSFYYKEDVSPTTPDELGVYEAWKADISAEWLKTAATTLAITCQIVKRVFPTDGPAFTGFDQATGSGGIDPLPTNLMVTLTAYAIADPPQIRPIRNSVFKPGLTDADVVDGELTIAAATLINALRNLMNQRITSPDGGEYIPMLRNTVLTVPVYTEIFQWQWRNIVRVVRRRTTNLCQNG